jgi:kynurenine 3-monooxygenase
MSESITSLNRETTIAIVGGGLVGSLLALSLTKRGFDVDVLERRPDMRKVELSAGRSINLALSTRGLKALHAVGLEKHVLKLAIPMRGRMIHSPTGELAFQQYGKDDSEYINSISRGELNKLLLDQAEATKRAHFHFNQKALGLDLFRNTLELIDESKNETTALTADIIIGSDGSASAIRNDMRHLPDFKCSEEVLDYGYKELSMPPGPGGSWLIEKHALHIWPRGTFMLIALPNLDGSFTCTLFLPYEGEKSFDQLKTPETVLEFFEKQFPDALKLLPDLIDQFFENPTGNMVTVKCSPWNIDGHALLLGDAAHAIVPFFGQGMNCGFEDVTVLEEQMDRYVKEGGSLYLERRAQKQDQKPRRQKEGSSGWETVFRDFSTERKVNTDAIADMAVENFIEMRDKVGNPRFLLEKAVEKRLQNEFPGEYVSRYGLVTFTNVPYNFALQAGLVTDQILKELCHNIESANEVDLKQAQKLVRAKLAPMLQEQSNLANTRSLS